MAEHKKSQRVKNAMHDAGEHLEDAAERLRQAPGKLGEHTLAAAEAGEHLVDKLAEKARRHKDDSGH